MIVNGVARKLSAPLNVVQLLNALDIDARGVAVAINGEVVRRSSWISTEICSADSVEIVTAVAGG